MTKSTKLINLTKNNRRQNKFKTMLAKLRLMKLLRILNLRKTVIELINSFGGLNWGFVWINV